MLTIRLCGTSASCFGPHTMGEWHTTRPVGVRSQAMALPTAKVGERQRGLWGLSVASQDKGTSKCVQRYLR